MATSKRLATWFVVPSTGANAIATATKAAPGAGLRHVITGYTCSGSGTPAAAVVAKVRENGGTVTLDQFAVPAATAARIAIDYVHPLRCSENVDVDINLPALGAGITGVVALRGYTESV